MQYYTTEARKPHCSRLDWTAMNNALYNATYDDPTIERSHISIMAPCFFTEADLVAGAAQDDQLIWDNTTWISGHSNVADSPSNFSTYDVLDTLVAYYMNTTIYPNLQVRLSLFLPRLRDCPVAVPDHHFQVVVVAGHSAGGQMTQRYVALRLSTEDDNRLHFWIGNSFQRAKRKLTSTLYSQPWIVMLADLGQTVSRPRLRWC